MSIVGVNIDIEPLTIHFKYQLNQHKKKAVAK